MWVKIRFTEARKEDLRGDCHEGQPTRRGPGHRERSERGATGYARSSPTPSTTRADEPSSNEDLKAKTKRDGSTFERALPGGPVKMKTSPADQDNCSGGL
ncbi:unnamed protein product, partial [Ascophyllum nodosum]